MSLFQNPRMVYVFASLFKDSRHLFIVDVNLGFMPLHLFSYVPFTCS